MSGSQAVTPRQFFEALYHKVGGGFIEIRPLLDLGNPLYKTDEGKKREASVRRFFAIEKGGAEKAAEYCLSLKDLHIYFGVGLRARSGKGTKDNIGCVTAAFADVDFKHIPEKEAIERIKKIPFKPSIVILSGGGAHVYWLLVDPVYQSGLAKLEALNRKLLKACGAQVGTQDATRILRVPGTANVKAEYPDPKPLTRIAWFNPEVRHDFEAMVNHFQVLESPSPALPTGASPAPDGGVPKTPPPPPAGATPTIDVQALNVSDSTKKVILEGLPAYISYRKDTDPPERFQKRQADGQLSRSEADAYVVSQLLAANQEDPVIYAIFRDPQNKIGEKYRERSDGDRYLSETVRKMRAFRAEHPRATNAAERVGRQLSSQFRDDRFEITSVVKIAYQEPIFLVSTHTAGGAQTYVTKCSDEELDSFRKFRRQYLIQNNKFPPPLKQPQWEALVNGVEFEVRKVEEEIATTEAEVREALGEWLAQAQNEVSESALQFFPVHDHEHEKTYLRIKPFMAYLKNEHIEVKRKRDVTEIVKRCGFALEARRIGKTVIKLWVKPNGQAPPAPAPPPQTTKDSLFETL